jgi:TldD protein
MSGGAATVKWDDEGVEPDSMTLVRDGILTDYQTTRESATWLAPYYQRVGAPIRSHGGAICSSIERLPTLTSANLTMAPSKSDASFDTLVAGTKKGIAVVSSRVRSDQQGLNAEVSGLMYEISNGVLGSVIGGATLWIRAPEFWKSLMALGGTDSVRRRGMQRQRTWDDGTAHTIEAPAARFTNVSVINDTRRG